MRALRRHGNSGNSKPFKLKKRIRIIILPISGQASALETLLSGSKKRFFQYSMRLRIVCSG
jgi:hypothetical protein